MVRSEILSKLRSALFVFRMPSLSPTMRTGKILRYHAGEGDVIPAHGLIIDVETNELIEGSSKPIQLEIELQDELYLAKILIPASKSASVNAPLAVLTEEHYDLPALQSLEGSEVDCLDDRRFQQVLWQAYVKNSNDAKNCGL